MKITDILKRSAGTEKVVIREVSVKQKGGLLGFAFPDLFAPNRALVDEKSVSNKLLEAYNGWVYANVSAIARSVSHIELCLYQTKVVGSKVEYEEVEDHPLLDILERFNDMTSQTDGFYITQAHLELAGDTFWLLDGTGKSLKNIYILEPDRVVVNFDSTPQGIQITSYDYKQKDAKGKDQTITYKPEQIIHFKVPDPANPVRGKSVVAAAAETIDTDTFAEQYNKNIFLKGALKNFVLSTDKNLSPEAIDQLEHKITKAHAGFWNANKTMILTGGLKPEDISNTNRDMEFMAGLQWTRDKIAQLFGNNKAVLGITDDVNRANAEATIDQWLKENIKPKMQRLVDTMNEFLVPQFGTNIMLGFEDPAPENRSDAVAEVGNLFGNAARPIITLNEARDRLGFETIDDPTADDVPQNAQDSYPSEDGEQDQPGDMADTQNPQDSDDEQQMPKALQNINYKAVLRRSGVYKQVRKQKAELAAKAKAKQAARSLVKPLVKVKAPEVVSEPVKRGSNDFSRDQLTAYWKRIDYISASKEKAFAHQVVRFLEQIETKVMAVVSTIQTKGLAKAAEYELFNMDDEVTSGVDLFRPLVSEIVASSGQEAYKLIKYFKSYTPSPTVMDTIQANTESFVTSMLTTDKERLLNIIIDGIKAGQSVDDISRTLSSTFTDIKRYQSLRVARTETIRAANMAAEDAFSQSGVVKAKEWLTAGDGNVDEECAAYDGQIVELGKDFGDGNPPLHPNCRCVIIPVLADSEAKQLKEQVSKLQSELDEAYKLLGVDNGAE